MSLERALVELDKAVVCIAPYSERLMRARGGKFNGIDLFAWGVLKRSSQLSVAFVMLVEKKFLYSARALLRLHLETAARFHALWLVNDPHDLSMKWLDGKKPGEFKDRAGKRLTDTYLMASLGKQNPWVPHVYRNTCEYVHHASKSLFAAVSKSDNESVSMTVTIGPEDTQYPPSSYVEAVLCFADITGIILNLVAGWTATKEKIGAEERLRGEPGTD